MGRSTGVVEGRHLDDGEWAVSVGPDEGSPIVVATQVAIHPRQARASFQAAVVAPGRKPILLAESDIAIPGRGWELRASGLWTDHICETPFRHWSYGLEAFALEVDDPAELAGTARGERVALGWELEFESSAEPELLDPTADLLDLSVGGYRQTGTGHGLLLIGDLRLEIEGRALRSHRWGPVGPDTDRLPAATGCADERLPPSAAGRVNGNGPLLLPGPDGVWQVTVAADGIAAATAP